MKQKRILIVSPEVAFLPKEMGFFADRISAKSGGLADVTASIVSNLFYNGYDVHLAIPNYKRIFALHPELMSAEERELYYANLHTGRVHFAEDNAFYYIDHVYSNYRNDTVDNALIFQREVINNIIPKVQPDIIHCHDWMTGLIPAYAKKVGIKSVFTVHNIFTQYATMQRMDDKGIDSFNIWENLYFTEFPAGYHEAYSSNLVDLLSTGIKSADYITTVSKTFLEEIISGQHWFIPDSIRSTIIDKNEEKLATGIVNAPDAGYDTLKDEFLLDDERYDESSFVQVRSNNKVKLQNMLHLDEDEKALMLFWPSRLDPVQKGCSLFANILNTLVQKYYDLNLQVVIVAGGPYAEVFEGIVEQCGIRNRVAYHTFSERLSHLAFASSDFIIMPSRYEPCGLPQMIGQKFGSLPIVHATGGLRDTVAHLDIENNTGSGFLFEHFDSDGLLWAIEEAIKFHQLSPEVRNKHIERIMVNAQDEFDIKKLTEYYIDVYNDTFKRDSLGNAVDTPYYIDKHIDVIGTTSTKTTRKAGKRVRLPKRGN